MRGLPVALALSAALVGVSAASKAHAFEREWHLGGGLGAIIPSRYYDVSPLVALHAAYGISDVFDARVEATSSPLGFSRTIDDKTQPGSNLLVALQAGLTYKVDVLRWIPYIGLLAGYYWHSGQLPSAAHFPKATPGAAVALGLDYAVTRQFGVGLAAAFHMLPFSDSTEPGYFTVLLRAEKRWGW